MSQICENFVSVAFTAFKANSSKFQRMKKNLCNIVHTKISRIPIVYAASIDQEAYCFALLDRALIFHRMTEHFEHMTQVDFLVMGSKVKVTGGKNYIFLALNIYIIN